VFFHPLHTFPGPRAAGATRFYYDYLSLKGLQASRTLEWHEKYGEVVRITPNQLSFTNERAWKDIYMHQQGKPQLKKVPLLPVQERAPNLLQAPDEIHARQRKMVAHAFSDRNVYIP
jgi:cytochrome P450